uniref:Glycosyltransferase n=1 Tax=viral metagenome TaxID=1070528 RepID=A0A6C0BP98_9ZZZZ
MSIPFTFHFIWVGPDPLPPNFARFRQTWQHHHPDASVRVWTNADREHFAGELPLLERLDNPAQQADVMRYLVLYEHGGIYCDHDMECLQSVEPFIKDQDLVVCNETDDVSVPYMSNSWIAARAKHPVFKSIVDRLHDAEYQEVIARGAINETTGPYLLGWGLSQLHDHRAVRRLPKDYMYPFLWFEQAPEQVPECTVAIHHWAASWKK